MCCVVWCLLVGACCLLFAPMPLKFDDLCLVGGGVCGLMFGVRCVFAVCGVLCALSVVLRVVSESLVVVRCVLFDVKFVVCSLLVVACYLWLVCCVLFAMFAV